MNNAYRVLPVYTGDVSGVCSALYELGGMIVIHDPSGCNSTYNTHDETRWYHQESLIFISGVKERDVIFGNDQKFIDDIIRTAEKLKPAFIALCTSPLPFLNGTDFKGIAHLLERKLGIPAFFVETTGMHDYAYGAGNAFAELARLLPDDSHLKNAHSVNLLGVTPLEFDADGAVEYLRNFVSDAGYTLNCCWSMGDGAENWKNASKASVNLVVSVTGLQAAKEMEKRFGIPYVVGCPVGPFADVLKEALAEAEKSGNSIICCREARKIFENNSQIKPSICIPGEPVTMSSLAAAIQLSGLGDAQVICPLEAGQEILAEEDLISCGEEDMERALDNAEIVIADPLYKYILGESTRMLELSHEAFSGRCFRKTRKNFMTELLPELEVMVAEME